MEATLYRPNAGIIIFNKKGKLLWCKRKTGDGWQFPQGGIDDGETPEEAVLRETYEEVGLDMSKIKIIKVTDSNIDKVNNLIQKKNQKVVGKFYADWCGHCNDLNDRVMPGVEEIIKKQSQFY